jgi:DNA phosphorothioation-dependent restriction protein DptH
MNQLILKIAKAVQERTINKVRSLPSVESELRTVFHGPPMEILRPVFDELVKDGGLRFNLEDGSSVVVPILLHSETGTAPPAVGHSGICAGVHLNDFRNQPACPRFVALLAPGNHPNLALTMETASDSFGLDVRSNSGNATIQDWWNDDFIQALVNGALERFSIPSEVDRDQARQMIQKAVIAADEAERHNVSRIGAWQVLSRIYCITESIKIYPYLSLACGFPPTADGGLAAKDQEEVLQQLASHLGDNGITKGLDALKEDATQADIQSLDAFGAHLHSLCDIPTTFVRAASYFYSPSRGDDLKPAPLWWQHLTLERWIELLEEERRPEGALSIQCTNSVFPSCRGGYSLVHSEVELLVSKPAAQEGVLETTVTRVVAGRGNTHSWELSINQATVVKDATVPPHKTPARYTVESNDLKKASIKVISLQNWEPGFFVFCRNARKVSPPKQPTQRRGSVDFECSMTLEGSGRHYIDIYTRPSVHLGAQADRYEDSTIEAERRSTPVARVDETTWGFEAETIGECYYDITVQREDGAWQVIRIYLTCDEVSPEGCKTEFERLIKLNRQQDGGRATTDVQLDRNVRCADLQTWLLAKDNVERSFYPLVVSTDYASHWRPATWSSRPETIFSSGRFLHDPRPDISAFQPPAVFIETRKWLAEKLRCADENGLIEAARLGEWLTTDDEFADMLHTYLQSYFDWLEAEPNVASWVDLIAFCGLEQDRTTLRQDPDAIILNPLHPIRLVWQAVAQKTLFMAYKRNQPCPAAGILDPDCVPDILSLPLFTASGSVTQQAFLAVECSSDYWSILWNGKRVDMLPKLADQPPFDDEFGVRIGGISSGFSLSQVRRSLDDVTAMLSAKPIISVMISSSSGQTNACNEGIHAWCKDRLGVVECESLTALGPRLLQILDLRDEKARPEDAQIANLVEDTGNAVKWFAGDVSACSPDLGIIAQLETSNAREDRVEVGSPIGWGALLRHRVRRQLPAADGAFLSESRVGLARPSGGDALADKLVSTLAKLENLSDSKVGFSFAPSVHAIQNTLARADFVAVSSSAVDPACFLGNWLPGYLWDYDLPSYSHRSGDTNGYYLISRIKETDRDVLRATLAKLPNGDKMAETNVDSIMLEVARRGIPTVRGLSSGTAGATGDLGLFIACRLLQDSFRATGEADGLLHILKEENDAQIIALIIPVDPFRGYLDDLQRAVKMPQLLRPDLLVLGVRLSNSECRIKLTPVEVKYRAEVFSNASCQEALAQAASLSSLFSKLDSLARDPDLVMWRLAFHHLLTSMTSFAFRVYSQQRLATNQSKQWTEIHAAVVGSLLSDEAKLQIDPVGRLVVLDKSTLSQPRDVDGDGFPETLALSPVDAASILTEEKPSIYKTVKLRLNDWEFFPNSVGPVQASSVNIQATNMLQAASSDPTLRGPLELPATVSPQIKMTKASGASGSATAAPAIESVSIADPVLNETPASKNGIQFIVGNTIDAFKNESRLFNPSNTNLNQLNIGVVGDLGTGKTQLLKALIYQLSNSENNNRGIRPRFLIFDYKKDYSDPDFVAAVSAKVVKPHHLPVNVFDISNSKDSFTPWLDRFNFFSDILDKIYSGIGPIQRKQLKAAVKQAYDSSLPAGRQPTIYDVNSAYSAIIGNKADSPSAILEDLVDRAMFSPEPDKAQGFDHFLDGVVVVDLASLGQDDRAKNMLVAVMLNLYYEHMLRIPKRSYEGSDPQLRVVDSFLMVDEADNIMRYEFDVLRRILLQGREFGVGVILASQYLRHFKAGASDYREPLLSWFIHKVPNITPSELQALGLTTDVVQMAERIKTLPKHCCLYKTLGVDGDVICGTPFYQLLKNIK